MSYRGTTRKKQEVIRHTSPLRYWLPGWTPEKFAEKNKHLGWTIDQCKEYCESNERKAKSMREATHRADHTRENDRDTTDEEDEIMEITDELREDAGYPPKKKEYKYRNEDCMQELHDAYDRERENNPQAR